jgi:hypothetical protein
VVERSEDAPPGGLAGPDGGPMGALAGGNGAGANGGVAGVNGGSNGHANFQALPNGSLAPQPVAEPQTVPAQAQPQPQLQSPRLDPAYAQKLLGPIPGEHKRELHTNLGEEEPKRPKQNETAKVGRNELCPCGSGKKFKRCHGVTA